MLEPTLRPQLLKLSPYYDRPLQYDARTHWEVACETFGRLDFFLPEFPIPRIMVLGSYPIDNSEVYS